MNVLGNVHIIGKYHIIKNSKKLCDANVKRKRKDNELNKFIFILEKAIERMRYII